MQTFHEMVCRRAFGRHSRKLPKVRRELRVELRVMRHDFNYGDLFLLLRSFRYCEVFVIAKFPLKIQAGAITIAAIHKCQTSDHNDGTSTLLVGKERPISSCLLLKSEKLCEKSHLGSADGVHVEALGQSQLAQVLQFRKEASRIRASATTVARGVQIVLPPKVVQRLPNGGSITTVQKSAASRSSGGDRSAETTATVRAKRERDTLKSKLL